MFCSEQPHPVALLLTRYLGLGRKTLDQSFYLTAPMFIKFVPLSLRFRLNDCEKYLLRFEEAKPTAKHLDNDL
ncbi:hypothetical protein M3J09_001267 [Ascochyta lentis]